ncbi:MAG: uridylate kinase [Proteobacteria bacterium]|nr:uridylate kinase [Pseudomonadota bacterium]
MRSRELSAWLETIESFAADSNIIIVPGGGEFADKVREMQVAFKFDDPIAHRMALLAMCQYGYLLSGMNSKLQIVEDLDALLSSRDKNLPFLWLPTVLIEDNSEIPTSWDFTSDSIALWLAIKLAAHRLILVKSKDLTDARSSIQKHIKNNNIDKGFQELINEYSGKILFMEKSQYRQLTDLIR